MNSSKKGTVLVLAVLLGPAAFGQGNLPAVDSLKKEVAKAVFAGLEGEKVSQISRRLSVCGASCDPAAEIRQVGSWNAVADKLAFFDVLKADNAFRSAGQEEMLKLLNNRLAEFYNIHKDEVIYKKALAEDNRKLMVGKVFQAINGQTPSDSSGAQVAETEPDAGLSDSTSNLAAEPGDEEVSSDSTQKQNQVPMWLFIAGTLGGLLLGAAGIYFMISRRAKETVFALQQEIENLKRRTEKPVVIPKPSNTATNELIPLPKNVQNQLALLDKIKEEVGSLTDPLGAIKQLKEATTPVVAASVAAVPDAIMDTTPVTVSEPQRPQVFYYPAPNEQGVFDDAQRSAAPTPDSAYKLIANPQQADMATFRFEPEPGRMKRFITYRTYFIDPACESENNYQEDVHSRIVTRLEGSATKENGAWRVQNKAVIRFE